MCEGEWKLIGLGCGKTAELILEQQREKGVQLRLDERIRERVSLLSFAGAGGWN